MAERTDRSNIDNENDLGDSEERQEDQYWSYVFDLDVWKLNQLDYTKLQTPRPILESKDPEEYLEPRKKQIYRYLITRYLKQPAQYGYMLYQSVDGHTMTQNIDKYIKHLEKNESEIEDIKHIEQTESEIADRDRAIGDLRQLRNFLSIKKTTDIPRFLNYKWLFMFVTELMSLQYKLYKAAQTPPHEEDSSETTSAEVKRQERTTPYPTGTATPMESIRMIFHTIKEYIFDFNLELATSISKTLTTQTNRFTQKFKLQLISKLYNIILRQRAETLDESCKQSFGNAGEFFEDDDIRMAVNEADNRRDTGSRHFDEFALSRLAAYHELGEDIGNFAETISGELIILNYYSLMVVASEDKRGKQMIPDLKFLYEHEIEFHLNEEKAAARFVEYILFICNEIRPSFNSQDFNSKFESKNMFILNRLADMLWYHQYFDIRKFTKGIEDKFASFQSVWEFTFKSNLLTSLIHASEKVKEAIESRKRRTRTPDRPASNQRMLPSSQPSSPRQNRPTDPRGESQPATTTVPENRRQIEPRDTYFSPDMNEFPVNRFKFYNTAHQKELSKKGYKEVSNQPAALNTNQIGPFTPLGFMSRHTRELNILNALKHTALHAYYSTLARNPSTAYQESFSPEFYQAEAELTKYRGELMSGHIQHPDTDIDDHPPYTKILQRDINSCPNVIIELQAFNEEGAPIYPLPIRTVAENAPGIFSETHTKQSLDTIIKLLRKVKWTTETFPNMTKGSLEISGDVDKHYDRLLHDIEFENNKEENRLEVEHPRYVGTDFNETDNTARSAISNSKYCSFSSPPYLEAEYQISSNSPFFTQTEAWQNWTVLEKMNTDIFQCFSNKFINSVDLRIKSTYLGKTYYFIWTIYRFTPEQFNITHFAYRSVNPSRTLMTPPKQINEYSKQPGPNDINMSTVAFSHAQTEAHLTARLDEVTLIQIHANGTNACLPKLKENLGKPNEDEANKTVTESMGWVYYYNFWTVIASCQKIRNPKNSETPEYITAYTIIHRTHEYATDKSRRKQAWNERRVPTAEPTSYYRRMEPQGPARRSLIRPEVRGVSYQPHVNPNAQKREERIQKAQEQHLPVFIFGLLDANQSQVYRYFQTPTIDQRRTLQSTIFRYQSLVYVRYYHNIINEMGTTHTGLHANIAHYITNYYQHHQNQINVYPGLFLKWIKDFPKGKPANDNETQTAQQYWSDLWMAFFNTETDGIDYKSISQEYTENITDQKIQQFIQVNGGNPVPRPPPPPPAGPGQNSSAEDESSSQGENDGSGDWDNASDSDNRYSQGEGSEGSGRVDQRDYTEEFNPEVNNHRQNTRPPLTPYVRPSRFQGRDDAGVPRQRDGVRGQGYRHYNGPIRGRGAHGPHGRYSNFAGRMQIPRHSLQSSTYPINEEHTHISELQDEINTLRRSLNQLALLQG